jgi:hypothetical protein
VARGAAPSALDAAGDTPLMVACRCANHGAVLALADAPLVAVDARTMTVVALCAPNAENADGDTALLLACRQPPSAPLAHHAARRPPSPSPSPSPSLSPSLAGAGVSATGAGAARLSAAVGLAAHERAYRDDGADVRLGGDDESDEQLPGSATLESQDADLEPAPAPQHHMEDAVAALLRAGASVTHVNRAGETALHLAVAAGHAGIAALLLRALWVDASFPRNLLFVLAAADAHGDTPAQCAAKARKRGVGGAAACLRILHAVQHAAHALGAQDASPHAKEDETRSPHAPADLEDDEYPWVVPAEPEERDKTESARHDRGAVDAAP